MRSYVSEEPLVVTTSPKGLPELVDVPTAAPVGPVSSGFLRLPVLGEGVGVGLAAEGDGVGDGRGVGDGDGLGPPVPVGFK